MTGDATETKVCPFCAETIKAAARVCPFCRSKQGKYVLLRQELLIAVPSLLLIIGAVVAIALLAPDERNSGRNFSRHRSDLIVLGTSWDRDYARKADSWLTGIVTNRGEYAWRIQELEVRFLDEQNNVLDVRQCEVKDSFAIQAHQEHGFRVRVDRLTFTNSSVIHQVRVQVATDGNRPVKTE